MARPRKDGSSAPKLSGGQASYVLERLIKDRRVSQSDVNGYLSQMSSEISELEARLQRLREAHGFGSTVRAAASTESAIIIIAASFVLGLGPGYRNSCSSADDSTSELRRAL